MHFTFDGIKYIYDVDAKDPLFYSPQFTMYRKSWKNQKLIKLVSKVWDTRNDAKYILSKYDYWITSLLSEKSVHPNILF